MPRPHPRRASQHPVRGARGLRRPGRHHRCRTSRSTRRRTRASCRCSTRYGVGAGPGDPVGHRPRARAGRRRHDGRRQRRPRADRPSSCKLVDRGVVIAAASRYMSGGQQIGGPAAQEPALAPGRAVALLVRPRRHPRRHQLVQGVLHRASCARSASTPTPASRSASSWWPRRAGCGGPSPRSRPSGSSARTGTSNFKVAELAAPLPRAGTGSPSGPSSRSTQLRGTTPRAVSHA